MPGSQFILPRNCENRDAQFNYKIVHSKFCSRKGGEAAIRKKKVQEKQEEQRQQLAGQIIIDRSYVSIAEAVVLFDISKDIIDSKIRKDNIPSVNLGERLKRISRVYIEYFFSKVEFAKVIQPTTKKQAIDFDLINFYTIGEISQKYGLSLSTVDKTIRKCSIYKKKIGKFVYVLKVENDSLFAHK